MEVFVGRQPIFDIQEQIFGFELLYRNSDLNSFPIIDGDKATMEVLIHSFITIGVEELANGKPCFINFTENLLHDSILDMLDPRHVIIEILEDVNITADVLVKINELKFRGFSIALDDFVLLDPYLKEAGIFDVIDYIKVDFLKSSQDEREIIEHYIKKHYPHIQLLAEKVETRSEFNMAKKSGYAFFQGYFFSKPQIIQGKEIPSNVSQNFQILQKIAEQDADISSIASLIERDVSLSFKLLKLINTSGIKKKVRSIQQAILLLGLDELHKWIYVLTLRETAVESSDPQTNALLTSSLFRAKFLELIAKHGKKQNASEYFLLGMFSMIEALLHKPFDQILHKLSLSDMIEETLHGAKTEMSMHLDLAVAVDQLQWVKMRQLMSELDLSEEIIRKYYTKAMQWTNELA
ncbi:EAL and HDOD domain-containing protein [Paenisporosarcina cavernae]|uniref:HDOD domain-containing protein n=1 Tax=Paenisporosarcina cavernae TaxID=2320858 RepID=A0A385YWU0_9BACL|nr:HDOD domain-containing protein [Paenisporosarcina cavernae]AYC30148.1 HDOD domain-containing protein [Paenisporosarcina cavernae]